MSCGKRYGKRRLVCVRPAGHRGFHAIRLTIYDLHNALSARRRDVQS